MKLIGLSLVLILASCSEGESWTINVTRTHVVRPGSNLTINCSFTHPSTKPTENVIVYWKIPGRSNCSWKDKNIEAFIFHSDEKCVKEKYRNKTRLVGNATNGDCSLQILNIREDVKGMYVRVYTQPKPYSFDHHSVSIFVNGTTSVTENPAKDTSTWIYAAIIVPVSALLIVLLVAGLFFCKRHKRSQNFKRKESGYYANFSRTSSDPPKRDQVSDKKDKELPDLKAIDEPVYINVEAPTYEMDQSMDVMDNIYANVDYTK